LSGGVPEPGAPALVRRVLKPILWIASLTPAGWLVHGLIRQDLGADPVKTLTHTTGLSALVILLVTLAVTPVRRLLDQPALIRLRRPLGLFAFFYATLHLAIYAVFDHRLSVTDIGADIIEHPWVLVGFLAFLILALLAATSPVAMVRRLGRRWQRLHRLVYLAAGLAVLHFFWLVKWDASEPLVYAAVLAVLLISRLIVRPRNRRSASPGS